MLPLLERLYVELESVELSLILKAQSGDVRGLSPLLQKRRDRLEKIGAALGCLAVAGMDGSELDRARSLQDAAVFRNKRIVTLLRKLYTSTKEEFLKLNASRAKVSPYGRPHSRFQRVTA